MKVRNPTFDLTGVGAHWAPNREWAHHINATGIVPSAIEPFLIKVVRRAKATLDPVADADLIGDCEVFNRQEAQHYRAHEQFNEAVAADGFPELLDHDRALKADYAEFLETKDLEWLVGYCESFESIVAVGATQWVDLGWGTYLDGADPRVVRLWRWHLAEEYEHRTVMHRLFHRICQGTPEELHAKRMELLAFFLEHLQRRTGEARAYLLATERRSMTPGELAASQQREAELDAVAEQSFAPVADVMAPIWDPAGLAAPKLLAEAFALAE